MALFDDGGGIDTAGPISTPVGGGTFAGGGILGPGGFVSEAARYFPGGTALLEGVRSFFGGVGATPTGTVEQLPGGGTSTTWGDMTGFGGGRGAGGGWRAGSAASVRSVIPRFLEGAAIAASVYAVYRELRGRGMGHDAAKRLAHRMHGIIHKRRRMKVTNPKALRRAMHRVKGARKMFSHVRGLMGVHHHRMGGGLPGRGSRPRRRGDLYDNVTAESDTIQDLLDDGYTPEEIEAFFGGIG
jgi:hypothetical protein